MAERSARQHSAAARQIASLLLAYPDESLSARLDLLHKAVAALPARLKGPLTTTLDYVRATPLGDQQQSYVTTFDLRKKCCLYLSWWVHGDTRNRGHALVEFKAAFREAGVLPPSNELPDHLAVVLEFTATIDPAGGERLLTEHRPGLELLRQALHKAESPYAGVLDTVCATLPGPADDAFAAARRIAATGPPTEMVGLEPYRMVER
ncbi:nitrate reductase molybdenum cofactor assembly chaperone [Phytoactinopolyspora mesophila]|uniref:Nitrate reductase molybdenum cofactor assembly chaperone n=1 Tax=Phytoactinopolyspora mesophila TaxID=2650750 RepID=A0A7K3M8I9_9ACTN|nr:nitrate reductase molybdenum cofactor assembly chaperone [Phytoactinopolyspora mesophila]NDL59671.1 nitrate reductase molybdenum cofactor assembly chaperone [Phytoactinopolyspora mesophila]